MVVMMVAVPALAQQPLSYPYDPPRRTADVGFYLEDISKQTGVIFSYSSQYVDVARQAKVSPASDKVGLVLADIFSGEPVSFREQGNKILIVYEGTSADTIRSYVVNGFVKEEGSGEAIIGAAVYVPGTPWGTITNMYGYYTLVLPSKNTRLISSYLGFTADTANLSLVADTRHDVFLKAGTDLKEVKVISTKAMSQAASFHHIVHNDIKTRAVLLGENDVIKTVQNLPGVQTGSGAGSLVLVRGGDPGQNLHLLDGVPLYNVDHFFGLTSIYNPDAIRSVDFYKGAFPARYGGRTASVIDVSTKDGDMQKWGGQFSMGLLKGGLTVEGPIKKDKASVVLSARRTWIDALWRPFTNDLELNFRDLNLKANYIVNNNNRLYLSAYSGRDRFSAFTSNTGGSTIWGNSALSMRWNSVLHPKLFMNTMVTYSTFNYVLNDKREMIENGEKTLTEGYKGVSGVKDIAFRSVFYWKPGSKHNFETGVQVSAGNFNPAQVEYFSQNTGVGTLPEKVRSNEVIFFVEDQIKLGGKFSLIPGIHFANWFSRQFDYSSIQPRLRSELALSKRHLLYASYAEMAQFLHLITSNTYGLPQDFWVPSSSRIEPEESYISTVGYRYTAGTKLFVNVEAYHKDIRNTTTYDVGKNLFDNYIKWDDKIIQGRGESYGAEASVRTQLGRFNITSAYTWSKTWRQFAVVNNGERFPYRYDRRHNFRIAALYQPSQKFDLTLNWLYMSGEAITMPDQIYPDFDNNLIINGANTTINSANYTYSSTKWNDYRLPAIHRLDAGMNFTKMLRRGKMERTWSIGVFNAYARRNVMFVDISYSGGSVGEEEFKLKGTSVLQFIPYVGYRLKI
jgi:hypothetical protein